MKRKAKRESVIRNIAEVDWEDLPGHFGGAFSKFLVHPETTGSQHIDYRISCYQPRAYVEPHAHKVQEQVYHVLEGEGLLTLDDRRVVMRKNDFAFVPPGVRHSFTNEGTTTLVFLVVTTPVEDAEVPI